MTWNRFEDIDAWQMARAYNQKIHELIQRTSINKQFALRNQMYVAAG